MKYNWRTLSLFLAESDKKYFRALINAVGAQVSPIISLFFKPPLTTILTYTCKDFHQIGSLNCIYPCIVSLDLPYLGHPLENSDR